MSAMAVALAEGPVVSLGLRAELAEGIKAAWHKSREQILKLGRLLIEAKRALPVGEFTGMIDVDLPFGPDTARRFMRIAMDPKLSSDRATLHAPESYAALDTLRKLSDEQFETAIGRGDIRPEMTVKEAQQVVRECLQPETKETGAAWNEIAAKTLHRPQAILKHAAPTAPQGAGATNLSELMYLLIQKRHALGHSQAAMDDKIGWADGYCSKIEILHRDEGRAPSIDAILEYAQGLKCGLQVVAL